MGTPKMVGTARDQLEAGVGAERKSGGSRRNIHKRNCRDNNGDNGDGDIRIGSGRERGRRRHWGPVAPVGRNGAGQKIKTLFFDDRRYTGRLT